MGFFNKKNLLYMGINFLLDQAKSYVKGLAEEDDREELKREIIKELKEGGLDGRKDA